MKVRKITIKEKAKGKGKTGERKQEIGRQDVFVHLIEKPRHVCDRRNIGKIKSSGRTIDGSGGGG